MSSATLDRLGEQVGQVSLCEKPLGSTTIWATHLVSAGPLVELGHLELLRRMFDFKRLYQPTAVLRGNTNCPDICVRLLRPEDAAEAFGIGKDWLIAFSGIPARKSTCAVAAADPRVPSTCYRWFEVVLALEMLDGERLPLQVSWDGGSWEEAYVELARPKHLWDRWMYQTWLVHGESRTLLTPDPLAPKDGWLQMHSSERAARLSIHEDAMQRETWLAVLRPEIRVDWSIYTTYCMTPALDRTE